MTNSFLWSTEDHDTNLSQFKKKILHKIKDTSYASLHNWSVKNKSEFWSAIWDFTSIKGKIKQPIIENEKSFINSVFFKNSKLNFTENIIQRKDRNDAIVFFSEQGFQRRISWKKLDQNVSKIAQHFIDTNIKKGDRIVGVLPNIPETVIAFLAAAKIGAIWSSCSADFGPKAIIDRFKQIKPKVLLISDYYFYNNKKIETLSKLNEIKKELPDLKEIIIIPYDGCNKNFQVDFLYQDWNEILHKSNEYRNYEQFEFNIPLYILFSSGTTGIPKCIVHGAGGSLIQHKKEHQLHCNIKKNDKIFYFTTCGWMMWNWLVSSLSSNASIYLYDGSPFYPDTENLFRIIESEKITFFGTGAKFLDYLKLNKTNVSKKYKLDHLKTIASTGSPLVQETFEYVYEFIKKNIHLASISGGTDIVSCFVLGNPNGPVYSGEIQCKGLGMDIDIYDEHGKSVTHKKGELVCKSPFPSKPLFFWNDKNNQKFNEAYFNKYPNRWHHGDYAEITENDGFIIHGRSDATLNSGGVRIGTAELYRVVENIENVVECIAVEHQQVNDTEVILFLKLLPNKSINDELILKVRNQIKSLLSPKHVPAKMIQVQDIPKTKNGKIVELTVKKIMNNETVLNLSSLINPESLLEYNKIAAELN